MNRKITENTSGGYIALLAVLIISTVFVFVSLQALLQQRSFIDVALSRRAYDTTFDTTRACSEVALMELRSNVSYTGGTVEFENGSCTVDTLTGSGSQNRSFEVHGVIEATQVSLLVRIGDLEDVEHSLQWSHITRP